MYSNPAVGHVWLATKVGQSYPLPSERRLPKTVASGGGRNRTMYSNPAVAVVSKCPTKGCQERCLLRPSVPATKSPIVDRPLRLREIPAPFTSRSPGIATLGPSCTPSRQLSNVVSVLKGPNEVVAEIPLLSVALASDSGHARWPLREMPPAVTVPGSLQVRYLRVVIVTM